MNQDSVSATALPLHGGDLSAAEVRFGRPASGWLDLSTGINPRPYPVGAAGAAPAPWHVLPDRRAVEGLTRAARAAYGVPEAAGVVAAPGTQAILQWLPRLRPVGRVAVLGPTYGEHARAWSATGHAVSETADLEALTGAEVAVVVNPNNPDGRRTAPDFLLALAEQQATRGGWLIVDEAFADVDPALSVAGYAGRDGLIVLRSFGKFFGLAGARLGFALTSAEIAGRLAAALGPWAVSGPALAVGTRALEDEAWQAETRSWLASQAESLRRLLSGTGLEVLGGTDLFVLAAYPRTLALYDHLGREGILTRAFAEDPDRLRFGLPADETGMVRLARALATFPAP